MVLANLCCCMPSPPLPSSSSSVTSPTRRSVLNDHASNMSMALSGIPFREPEISSKNGLSKRGMQCHQQKLLQEAYANVFRRNLDSCRPSTSRRQNSFRNFPSDEGLEGKSGRPTWTEAPEEKKYSTTAGHKGTGVLILTSPLGMHKNSKKRRQVKAELDRLARLARPSGNYWEMLLPPNPHCPLELGGGCMTSS